MAFVLALTSLLVASTAQAALPVRHSGKIVAVDTKRSTVTLEEMGPWKGPGKSVVRRSIHLAPTTKVELVTRSKGAAPDRWLGGFTESPLPPADLHPGDYVTVSTVKRQGRLDAVSVEVVRPRSPAGHSVRKNRRGTLERNGTRGYVTVSSVGTVEELPLKCRVREGEPP